MHQAGNYQQLIHSLVKHSPSLWDWLHQEPLLGLGMLQPGQSSPWWNVAAKQVFGLEATSADFEEQLSHVDRNAWNSWLKEIRASQKETFSFCLGWDPEGANQRCLPLAARKISHPQTGEPLILLALRWKDPSTQPLSEEISEVETLLQLPHHQVVIEALSEGIVVQDDKDQIVLCNDSAARILGLTKNQLLGKDSFDPRWKASKEDGSPFAPEEHPSVMAVRTGQPQKGVLMNVYSGEEKRSIISVNAQPILDGQGKIIGSVATFQDVTDQKENEQQLQFQANLLAGVGQALIAADIEGKVTYWNHVAEKMFGLSSEEALGLPLLEAAPNDKSPEELGQIMTQLREGHVWAGTCMFEGKEGRMFPARVQDSPVTNLEGQFIGMIGVVEDISEQLAAEKALQESEERFKSFAENLPGMVYIKYPAGPHVYGNQANLDYHQVSMEAYQTKTAWDFLNPELAKFVEEMDLKVAESQTSSRIDFFMEDRNHWIREYKFPIGQNLIGSFAMDITAQKKAELALKRSEEQYRNITNSVPGAVLQYKWHPDGQEEMIFTNQQAKVLAGMERGDTSANLQKIWQMVLPSDKSELATSIQESAQKLKFWNHEWRIYDLHGNLRWLNGRGIPRKLEDGTILWHTLILDITKKVETHNALKESEAQLRSIAEHIGEVVWLRSESTREVLFVNHAFDVLTGYPVETLYENSDFFFDLIPTAEQAKAAQALLRYRKTGLYNEEHQIIRADGTRRWVWVRLFPVKNENGQIISHTGLAVDISRRKEAEVVRQRIEHLEARNQEMEQFTYVASHDMQEPLRTIISFVGLLEKRYRQELPEPAQEYLQFINDAAHRMNDLIRELLNYSRLGKGRTIELVDCEQVLKSVLQDLHATIQESGAEIAISSMPKVLGVEVELRQLFQNLISNAIKFRFEDTRPKVQIQVQEQQDYWEFAIQDNGIGIPEKYLERIFHLFQRLNHRDQYVGTGIGLAHCRKIVELHYGEIWVESAVGKGTTFFFSIRKDQPLPVGDLKQAGGKGL